MNEQDRILLDVPMPIETERLLIRPVQPGDGTETAQAIDETFDQLKRWMPWAKDKDDADMAELNIRKAFAQLILREDFRMVAIEKATNRMVVFTGLHRIDWDIRRFETGYWTRKDAQGKGFATESANALTRYAFDVFNAQRVVITHARDNDASRAVIEKLGFEREGIKRKNMALPDGLVVDEYLYARLDKAGLPDLDVEW